MSAPALGPRLLAGLVIVLTFVVGGLAGAVADRTMGLRPAVERAGPRRDAPPGPGGGSHGPQGRERDRERFVQQMARDLSLSPAQVAQIDTITRRQEQRLDSLRRTLWPRVHAVIEETRGEIDQVLTPAQQAKVREVRKQWQTRKQPGPRGPGSDTDTTSGKR